MKLLAAHGVAASVPAALIAPTGARASLGPGPKKLVTILAEGGWFCQHMFSPLTAAQVGVHIPEKGSGQGGVDRNPRFYAAEDLKNLDGSGDAPDDDPRFQRLRAPHLWDSALLAGGGNLGTGDFGWSWVADPGDGSGPIYENAVAIHGVDQGTAAHDSGKVAALSGLAGAGYKIPAAHCVVADAVHAMYGESRPLGAVSVGAGAFRISHLDLPAHAIPTAMRDLSSIEATLSDRADAPWAGLRHRNTVEHLGFDGMPTGEELQLTEIEAFAMARSRGLLGRGDDRMYEALYDSYATVSRQLALDIVTILEGTPGWEGPPPTWAWHRNTPYSVPVNPGHTLDTGEHWNDSFELALKLLKSDLCSAINLQVKASGASTFDTHSAEGHNKQFVDSRMVMEVIGRFLMEMKRTPSPSGGLNLLDDTLVLIVSDFSRDWPKVASDNHWPISTMVMAGGGLHGNRMVGAYDLPERVGNPGTGLPVDMILEDGTPANRPPTVTDFIYTAYDVMGIELFMPGGPGKIVGVKGEV
ncbi:MAG: DUF1501 domain-containing protein [Myxococcota bacterium]